MSDQLRSTLAELDLRVSQAEEWLRQLDQELHMVAKEKVSLHTRLEAQLRDRDHCQRETVLELQAVADLQCQLEDLDCLGPSRPASPAVFKVPLCCLRHE